MTGALALSLLALGSMYAGVRWLPAARWTHRSPRLAIAVWQALTASIVASLGLACLALMVPGLSAAATLGEMVRACVVEIGARYSTPGGALMSTAVLGVLVALVGRVGLALWWQGRDNARSRADHVARLSMVSKRSEDGVHILDHPSAMVYCVPGERRSSSGDVVVMTQTAVEALTVEQVALVLCHERAHLRSRHGRLVERSRALASALPFIPFFRVAHEQIAQLVEMHADEVVAPGDRQALADALYRLSASNQGGLPSAALGATSHSVLPRVRRLVHPNRPLGHGAVAAIAALIIGIGVAPATLAFLPTGSGVSHDCCVLSGESAGA